MDTNLIVKFRQSIIIKGILVFLFVLYIGLFLLINIYPKDTLVIPGHMVEDGTVFNQPVEIIAVEPYTIRNNGIIIDRYQIETPGSYSFQVSQPNSKRNLVENVSFRVVIYSVDTAWLILGFAIVPMTLLLLTMRRGHHDII
jgi:hypothetical protein